MPAKGTTVSAVRPMWKGFCWVCGEAFESIRSTAMCCGDACKQARCRHFKKTGEYMKRHPNAYRSRTKIANGIMYSV